MTPKIKWPAFWAWIGVGLVGLLILADEELGILHVWGLSPITWVSIGDLEQHKPLLATAIFMAGITFSLWWLVHLYRRIWGDLSQKKNWLVSHTPPQ